MYHFCRIEVPQPALLDESPFDLFSPDPEEDVQLMYSDPEEDVERMFSGPMELDLGTPLPLGRTFIRLMIPCYSFLLQEALTDSVVEILQSIVYSL
jgi:hypothetical protein